VQREGWQAVFVLGSPAYYGRFGFDASPAQGYHSPYKGADFMALLLDEGLPRAGRLTFPAAFDEDIREHAARSASFNNHSAPGLNFRRQSDRLVNRA
jgi:hypothetical protein